jgi:hypothetical protein
MLSRRIDALVRELLPRGQREGHEWRCGSVAGEAGRSLSVHLSGPRAGVWADFSSADDRGDALDLVGAILFNKNKTQALAWSRAWLGIDAGAAAVPVPQRREPPSERATAEAQAEEAGRRKIALEIWLAAQPSLSGTPAAAYLRGRGIDLAELQRQPRALRFHPSLINRQSSAAWPALVAAVSDGMGAHVATHRTWLARVAGGWGKAPLRDPKMSLGTVRGGFIPLWRGASGKSLRQAPEGDAVAIAEGIETALSVAIACPELRVLSAVSLGNMGRLVLPPAVHTVILCADNDGDNPQAAATLQRAIDRYAAEGRTVRLARPSIGKDFNDQLRAAEA